MHGESLGNSHLSSQQGGFAEAERKSLSDLCPESNGIWQRDLDNDSSIHAYVPARSLRSLDSDRLIVPSMKTVNSDRRFSVAGPRIWNSLPMTVKDAETLDTFKSRLKTYLFTVAVD